MPNLRTKPRCLVAVLIGSALLPAAAGYLPAGLWASPTGARQDPIPQPSREARSRLQIEMGQRLVGQWQLKEFIDPGNTLVGATVVGVLSVDTHTLSFVTHIDRHPATIFQTRFQFQGGLHHWRISDALRLQTASILSHSNLSGDLIFEPQYTLREYELEFDAPGRNLTMTRPDGTQLILDRVLDPVFPERALDLLNALKAGQSPPDESGG